MPIWSRVSCCGARCAPCRRCGFVAHRPRSLAPLPSSATGSGRVAPYLLRYAQSVKRQAADPRFFGASAPKKSQKKTTQTGGLFLSFVSEKELVRKPDFLSFYLIFTPLSFKNLIKLSLSPFVNESFRNM